jgi:hypothetical protein
MILLVDFSKACSQNRIHCIICTASMCIFSLLVCSNLKGVKVTMVHVDSKEGQSIVGAICSTNESPTLCEVVTFAHPTCVTKNNVQT